METGWDFGFVQVLDGEDFVSLPCTGTTSDANPQADPAIASQVPGYTGPTEDPNDTTTVGTAATPEAVTCDLSAYAGQEIVLAFRFMSDPLVQLRSWHIRDVAVGGAAVDPTPGDLSDWDNEQFFTPVELGFKLTFVGIDGEVDEYGHVTDADKVVVVRADLNAGSTYSLTKHDRNALKHRDEVIAIVSGVPEDEMQNLYFPYSLTVKGEERADGANLGGTPGHGHGRDRHDDDDDDHGHG
jgi:hypothetical protein